MGEFGHHAAHVGSFHIDAWGSGPFVIEVAGKRHRFEDSDRFGPIRVSTSDVPLDRQWGERHPFWAAHRLWRDQGRRLAADGITCIWSPGRPTIIRKIGGRNAVVVSHGELDGAILDADTPEGQAALQRYGVHTSDGGSA